MWFKDYKDYPIDTPLKKERLEPGKGFNGCEMREFNGWGHSYTQEKPRKKGFFSKFLNRLRGLFKK